MTNTLKKLVIKWTEYNLSNWSDFLTATEYANIPKESDKDYFIYEPKWESTLSFTITEWANKLQVQPQLADSYFESWKYGYTQNASYVSWTISIQVVADKVVAYNCPSTNATWTQNWNTFSFKIVQWTLFGCKMWLKLISNSWAEKYVCISVYGND